MNRNRWHQLTEITGTNRSVISNPHLHCIVPGGGLDGKGRWRRKARSDKYLFSVKALSKVFRAKYVQQLCQQGLGDKALLESLFRKDWVVHVKRPFGGPQQVINYLGRYTHKVAIGNHRLVDVDEKRVSFRYRDYRQSGLEKVMTLAVPEFVRRFARHILSWGFVRIRHYGILSNRWKRRRLPELRQGLKMPTVEGKVVTLLRKCPCCKTGTLITIEVFGKRGPPQLDLRGARITPTA